MVADLEQNREEATDNCPSKGCDKKCFGKLVVLNIPFQVLKIEMMLFVNFVRD